MTQHMANVPRSVQIFENILLALSLAYVKYYSRDFTFLLHFSISDNGTMETICSYEWDDVDAGVLCRHLGMGMSGRATYLPRDWSSCHMLCHFY
jgi:hypothetical protein